MFRSLRRPRPGYAWLTGVVAMVVMLWAVAVFADEPAERAVLDTAPNGALQIEPIPDPAPPVDRGRVAEEPLLDPPAAPLHAETVSIPRTHETDRNRSAPWYRSGLVSLAIVLAVISALAWCARRLFRPACHGGADILRVVARTTVTPKHSIALVQMGRRLVFVGVGPETMTPLRLVEDDDEANKLRAELRLARGGKRPTHFDELLTGEAGRLTTHLESALASPAGPGDSIARTRKDLQGLLHKLRSQRQSLREPRNHTKPVPGSTRRAD